MFGRFKVYIDIITDNSLFDPILDVVEERNKDILPITHVGTRLMIPAFKHDFLIVDFHHMPGKSDSFEVLKSSFAHVLMVNVPADESVYDMLEISGINFILREGFKLFELKNMINVMINLIKSNKTVTYFEALLIYAQNSIVITDKKGLIQYANPYFEDISKYNFEELQTQSIEIIASGEHPKDFYIDMWNKITMGQKWDGIFTNIDKAGKKFYEEATISPMYNTLGEIENYIKIGKNITHERILLEELNQEIKLSKKILAAFLPSNYSDDRVTFAYKITDFNQIGGDYIVFDHSSDNVYNIAMLDVMGHGASAAMFAIAISQMFKDYISYMNIGGVVRSINNLLRKVNDDDDDISKYLTAVFIQLDFNRNQITAINAGHPDILVVRQNGEIECVESNNSMMGVLHTDKFKEHILPIEDYKRIIVFTDGVHDNLGMNLDDLIEKFKSLDHNMQSSDLLNLILTGDGAMDDASLCVVDLPPLIFRTRGHKCGKCNGI